MSMPLRDWKALVKERTRISYRKLSRVKRSVSAGGDRIVLRRAAGAEYLIQWRGSWYLEVPR